MTDAAWIKSLDKITDPTKALKVIVENEGFFGFDPYYRDLRAVMLKMAERVVNEHSRSKT